MLKQNIKQTVKNQRLSMEKKIDVLIIGAGPSGSIVSALLHKLDIKCLVIEKEVFPRFVIGESLLPFCMHSIEKAGFLDAVLKNQNKMGFQFKNGAAFVRGDSEDNIDYRYFEFSDKSSDGYGTTFQVRRAEFDKLLIDEAISQGVSVEFNVAAKEFNMQKDQDGYISVTLSNRDVIKTKFLIDASGYGRVLPKALNLEIPSSFPPRMALFTHIQDRITEPLYDRKKILIATHAKFHDVWFWLIPFSDGFCSIGVVGEKDRVLKHSSLIGDPENLKQILKDHVYQTPMLSRLLRNAIWDMPTRLISGYSTNVKSLHGENYALLGNAGEFLDPVFSSGVTIAMHSATLLAPLVARIINGEDVNLEEEYAKPLNIGINAFKTYVSGWYNQKFQKIIFSQKENFVVKRHICSILAGFAWDDNNPYVSKSSQAIETLYQILYE